MNSYTVVFKFDTPPVTVQASKFTCDDYSVYTFYDVNHKIVFMAGCLDVLYVRKVENE